MRFRIAKPQDARQIAHIHWCSSVEQPGGYMHKLGEGFLREYYKVLLNEPNSVVICAEDNDGEIHGFLSGSLKTEEHSSALKNNRARFLLATLPVIIKTPSLIRSIYSRQKLKSADEDVEGFIVLKGARSEYWGWLPSKPNHAAAIGLYQTWLALVGRLGVSSVRFEVDQQNDKIVKIHRKMGATIVKVIKTPDGTDRYIMEHKLK